MRLCELSELDGGLCSPFDPWAGGEIRGRVDFRREAVRRARGKRQLSCGHWIDGGELYRYSFAKLTGYGGLLQALDCDECARADARY